MPHGQEIPCVSFVIPDIQKTHHCNRSRTGTALPLLPGKVYEFPYPHVLQPFGFFSASSTIHHTPVWTALMSFPDNIPVFFRLYQCPSSAHSPACIRYTGSEAVLPAVLLRSNIFPTMPPAHIPVQTAVSYTGASPPQPPETVPATAGKAPVLHW